MKKLVIGILFIAFSFLAVGCGDVSGPCAHGVCKQGHENPTAQEKGLTDPSKEG